MERYFPDIVDLKFTAQMERELDEVEEGRIPWKKVLRDFYDGFEKRIETGLEEDLDGSASRSRRGHGGDLPGSAGGIWW